MSGIKDQHNLDDLRNRLYSRGSGPEKGARHELSKSEAKPVPRDWSSPKRDPVDSQKQQDIRPATSKIETIDATEPLTTQERPETVKETPALTTNSDSEIKQKKRWPYRKYIVIATFFILFSTIVYSIGLLFLGGNQISPSNVAIEMKGPFSVGGGEEMPIEVSVTNENTAPIKSATLIVSYPPGTKSSGDNSRTLFEERLPLDDIASGENIKIPIRPIVFGEENTELTIEATIEYRLEGSNGTFFKDAAPHIFKISSSPLIVKIDAVEQISSGQETDIILSIKSNSPAPLTNLLVVAEYPRGFDYTTAVPEPALGQNTWQIDTLEPGENIEIVVTGVVIGQEDDQFEIQFKAGSPSNINKLSLGSVLTTASTKILIERPFISVKLEVSGEKDGIATLSPGQSPSFSISVTNTLEDPVYDVRVVASLSGNALSERSINVKDGFYDSVKNEVRWSQDTLKSLNELIPGKSEEFLFDLEPGSVENTPEVEVNVDVYARRVASAQAAEELIGTIKGSAKIETEVQLDSEMVRTSGDTGPIPPQVETETEYTFNLVLRNSTNDVTGGVVTFQLPPYVIWEDDFDGDGDVIFNPVSKEVTWDVGDIKANAQMALSVGLTLSPSANQVNQIPTLVSTQRFRGTDRFTGTVIRSEASTKTSELSQELGFPRGNGTVVSQ